MRHTSKQLHRSIAATALLTLLTVTSLAAADSPQDAFATAVDALQSKNYAGLVEAVAPSERALMAFSLTTAVDMGVSFWEGAEAEAAQKTFAALKEKHGIKDDEGEPELAVSSDTPQEEIDAHIEKLVAKRFGEVDLKAYVAELVDFFMKTPMMEGESLLPDVELTDLEIVGDRATGKAGDAEIEFVREGGRWYMASP